MNTLTNLAHHLEALNAFAEALDTHSLPGTVALTRHPSGQLFLFLTAPHPDGRPFFEDLRALCDHYELTLEKCGFSEFQTSHLARFLPSLDVLGSPIPGSPFTSHP